ncbi:hypothetical protein [Arthrobacter sp. SLBN-53]|uniref:hypothetical protein n=1 Tax=Arthrobacter sp. SLBN-53 TaxID=2768412 RepID=UPI001152C8D2|nr:hypothetical protein [Arthrobacter sp. SLBN-53]
MKFLLIGVAVLLVIAVSVGATLLFARDDGKESPSINGTPPADDTASANDNGPISIIVEDPTCAAWRPIASTLSKQQNQGWEARDPNIPATSWTPAQKSIQESVAAAMQRAADQTLPLAKQTPHRVMRDLYEQSTAFWRAYAESIPTYTPIDNELARTANASSNAVTSICTAIENGAALSRGSLIEPGKEPTSTDKISVSDNPVIFIKSDQELICREWLKMGDKFDRDAAAWLSLDPNIEASEWTPKQQRDMAEMSEIMTDYANNIESKGRKSGNSTFEDIAMLSAQYWRAFVKAIPSYTTADSYLSGTASSASFVIYDACLGLQG